MKEGRSVLSPLAIEDAFWKIKLHFLMIYIVFAIQNFIDDNIIPFRFKLIYLLSGLFQILFNFSTGSWKKNRIISGLRVYFLNLSFAIQINFTRTSKSLDFTVRLLCESCYLLTVNVAFRWNSSSLACCSWSLFSIVFNSLILDCNSASFSLRSFCNLQQRRRHLIKENTN